MSSLITAHGLGKSYAAKPLFHQLSLSVVEGDRLGIFGPNGAGKSSLLRILAGLDHADEGQVVMRSGTRVTYLAQDSAFDPQMSLLEIGMARLPHDENAQRRIETLLDRHGFADVQVKVSSLSGGWRKRFAILLGLLDEPDVYILDEPTNHLDLAGILWLEQLLAQARFTWILVSHDRYFLNKTAKTIAELNPIYGGGLGMFAGNYETFLDRRREYLEGQAQRESSLANKVRREEEWLRQGVKARTTKSRSRIDEAHRLIGELASLSSRLRQNELRMGFEASGRKTRVLMRLENASKSLGDKCLFRDLNLIVSPGTKIGLLGGNGTGKSTLLKALQKTLPLDEGQVFQAPDVRIAYFDQHRDELSMDWTLKRALGEGSDTVVYRNQNVHVVSWARRFQFRAEQLDTPVRQLSGGEKARVLIARLMLKPADVLLLDEPTNDLDITTLEVLEESLNDFPGGLVIVSHDRFLMDTVCDVFVGLDGQGGSELYASYDQWESALRQKSDDKKVAAARKAPTAEAPTRRDSGGSKSKRLSYMEQREFDGMEHRIMEAEERLASLRQEAEDPAVAASALRARELFENLRAAEDEVARLYARWAELEAKAPV